MPPSLAATSAAVIVSSIPSSVAVAASSPTVTPSFVSPKPNSAHDDDITDLNDCTEILRSQRNVASRIADSRLDDVLNVGANLNVAISHIALNRAALM